MTNKSNKFLDSFPDHVFRYLDTTGNGRPAFSSINKLDEKNSKEGYDAYFTVNGFADFKKKPNAIIENLTSLNAFWVDIDGRKDEKELEEIKKILDPTFILETGNGHHIYWVLDEPIYRKEIDNWEEVLAKWNKLEQNIVATLNGDKGAQDSARIMRIPETFYWKKSVDAYKKGTDGVFKIKGIYKNLANSYTMEQIEEAFPIQEQIEKIDYSVMPKSDKVIKYADAEKKDFFHRVNEKYPIEGRQSFQKLITGLPDTLPKGEGQRNHALLVTASLMRQAGWSKNKAIEHINKIGWHGIEKERGGQQEILNTINSAYNSGYTYSYKNEIIAWNMSEDEQRKIQEVYTAVFKDRKEIDKTRFSNYEYKIIAEYSNLKKNESGIVFNYEHGVYRMLSDQEISNILFRGLYEDMLWGYRTGKNVSDKIKCLLSIIPDFKITDDHGYTINVRNGLLNIVSRELKPHTPDFVSLIQYPVDYNPDATCSTWDSCIDAWMEGSEKEEKTLMLQQYCGYILSSSMTYDMALFLIGDGGNGKSTFIDTIGMLLGKEATSHIDLESLYGQYGMKGLIGKRLNIVEEIKGNYYESNKIKKLISGQPITIDVKYKDQFDFTPQCKFVFAVNLMPRIDDPSVATERRLCIVHFLNNFRKNPNRMLRFNNGLLAKELSGILNWMLDGAEKLAKDNKFIITKEMTKTLGEYREENSSVEGFIGECLEFQEGETLTVRRLYDKYKQYCIQDGRKFKSNITFTKEIKAYGIRHNNLQFIERKYGGDTAKFEGVCFTDEWAEERDKISNRLNF